MHKSSTREEAIRLRLEGYSYPHISKQTGISKSTLSGWLADVPYTPNEETVHAFGKARAAATARKTEIRQREMKRIREEAFREIGEFTKRDLLILGLGLYMGEGAKTNGAVSVANSDPEVIKSMVAWFRVLGVQNGQFSARIFMYPDCDQRKSLQFWSVTTSIPRVQFQATYIDRRADKKKKKEGRLPHGTLHLYVRARGQKEYGVLFSRKIQALTEAVREKCNAGLV